MKFVIGGFSQGKLAYVCSEYGIDKKAEEEKIFYAESDKEEIVWQDNILVIKDFHLLVRHWMQTKQNIEENVKKLLEEKKDCIIISNEIGYGIVPYDAFERAYREQVGRISCIIAKRAEQVIRVTCGIGVRMK